MTCRCIGLLLASGGIVTALAGCEGREAEATSKVAAAPKAVTVTVAPLEHRAVMRTVDAVGTLHGWEEVTIGAKREGRVRKVLHDMGDRVAPGDLLVELESEDSDLAVEQAQHQLMAELAKLGLNDVPQGEFDVSTVPAVVQAEVMLTKARQNLGRERSLMQRSAGTKQDLQNAENDVRGYEAALANAVLTARSTLVGAQAMKVMLAVTRYRRSEMKLHAPVPSVMPEGVTGGVTYAVAKRKVSEGQMLKQGDAIAELVIENPLRLKINVPQHYTDDVKVGQGVGLLVSAHPGTVFEGKVARINPMIDDASRTFQVEVHVPNNRNLLRPGGSAKAAIVISEDAQATTVPIGSDFTFAGVTKIFVVEGDKARAIPVTTGLQGDGWIEVIGNLPAAAQVVTTGQVHLAEGTPVVIRPDAAAAAAARGPKPVAQSEERSQRETPRQNKLTVSHPPLPPLCKGGSFGRDPFLLPPFAKGGQGGWNCQTSCNNRHLILTRLLIVPFTGSQRANSKDIEADPMTISDVCIKRPVFTWVLVAIPVVLGLVSYNRLGVDLFPNVDFPVCTITTVLSGASVEEMETSVTKPLEDIINTVSGIDELRSTTMEGVSTITVQFLLSKDGDVGTQEVRDKVNTILGDLPDGTEAPIIDKFDTGSMPVMTVAVSGRRDFREVTELARKQIKERLETVSGVGAVTLAGGRIRAMNVVVDAAQLSAYGLSVDDVRTALVRQNLEVPGGRINQGPRELVLRTLGRLSTAAEFNSLIVANRNGYPIRVSDIGRAEDSFEEPRTLARLDGASAVSLVIQKQSGQNTVKVVDDVTARLEQLKPTLPPDITTEIIRDQSRFIRKSIEEVKFHLLLAGVLVSATILLFIRDWRTTVIATLAIPTSIVPTFAFMWYMGFTLNNITMLGLILAIGIVIDDAVVVHENIFRHMEEEGMDGMEAAGIGTREIALPVLATSLSLIVIFLPIAFMGGIVGRFFSSFGLTVAFAVAMSLFVSFTLTPMLCSRFLKLEPGEGGHAKSKSGFFYRLIDGGYGGVLKGALRFKPLVVVVALLVTLSTAPIFKITGMALIPRDDQSEYEVTVTTPEGYSLERASKLFAELEGRLNRLRGTVHIFTTIGETSGGRVVKGQGDVTRGTIYVRMNDLGERDYTQYAVQQEARDMLLDYPDLRASVNDVSAFQNGRRPQTFQVNLAGPDLNQLSVYADELIARLKDRPGLVDLDTTLSLRKPEVQVIVDREAASDVGIPVGDIADTLRILVGGMPISKFRDGAEQYDVWLRAEAGDRSSIKELEDLSVPSPKAGLVRISSLATLADARGPSEIERYGRQRIVTVVANPETIPLGEAVNRAQKILEEMKLPPQYSFEFSGQAKTMGETGYYFLIAFGLSALFMYMILAAQFESWTQPVSILMALPVTVPFGLLSLVLFHTPMDIYAMFGLFMLVGIVKKNGILQVDATNQLRAQGRPRHEAIVEANHTRLRPILMTTVMLIAAMVPIALGQGPGAGARASMAKVIIGGQALSLVLALLVTPVFYALLDMWVNFTRRIGIRFSVAPADRTAAGPKGAGGLAGVDAVL